VLGKHAIPTNRHRRCGLCPRDGIEANPLDPPSTYTTLTSRTPRGRYPYSERYTLSIPHHGPSTSYGYTHPPFARAFASFQALELLTGMMQDIGFVDLFCNFMTLRRMLTTYFSIRNTFVAILDCIPSVVNIDTYSRYGDTQHTKQSADKGAKGCTSIHSRNPLRVPSSQLTARHSCAPSPLTPHIPPFRLVVSSGSDSSSARSRTF
jgi:hypothetical protein